MIQFSLAQSFEVNCYLRGYLAGLRYGKIKRGWVFTKEGTHEEIGFAESEEYENADAARHGFRKVEAGHFDVYFRDVGGVLQATADVSTPESFF